jgi:hypothetical protein
MAAARFGDVVQVEAGTYPERVNLRDGVDLVARNPGTVVISRPSNASGEVVALTVFGGSCGTVSGVNIESTPELPIDVGVRVSGQGCVIQDMSLAGEMRVGIEINPSASVLVRASQFYVRGYAVTLGDDATGTLVSNTILAVGRLPPGPIGVAPSSRIMLQRNVFGGFGAELMKGMPAGPRQQLLAGNFVIASEPSLMR